jgi:hypothetical protein
MITVTPSAFVGTRLLDVALASRSERANENAGAMQAQDAAQQAQSEGLKPQRTAIDELRDAPSPLDRFAD